MEQNEEQPQPQPQPQRTVREAEELAAAADGRLGPKLKLYSRRGGPGWLQGAIALGGGSLASALYLGVIGGTHFMWLLPLAMIMGVIMLSAISYVTLSTGQRLFCAVNEHISPVLGWAWLIATMMANMVWVLPHSNLAWEAVQENLVPGLPDTASWGVSGVVLAAAVVLIWCYGGGGKGNFVFETLLKIMVGLVVVSFMGVVVALSLAERSPLKWGEIFAGLVPNLRGIFSPTPELGAAIAQTGEFADYWTKIAVGQQRDVMITVFATVVGINMTFLLPYSMLRKNWGKRDRGLAIFDLSTGLYFPFIIGTGCLVIAAASQFHGKYDEGLITSKTPSGSYVAALEGRLKDEHGSTLYRDFAAARERKIVEAKEAPGFAELSKREQDAAVMAIRVERLQKLPEADRIIAAMIEKRDQWALTDALQLSTGGIFAQYMFGFGVLVMALSTIIVLMLINGFVLCEIFNVPATGWTHRVGCLIVGVIGYFGPAIWGKAEAWLTVPASVIGGTLLPIAYITFFMMMNSKSLLGDAMPTGGRRVRWNLLMGWATAIATIAAIVHLVGKPSPGPQLGLTLVGLLVVMAVMFPGKKAGQP